MAISSYNPEAIQVRLAQNEEEIRASQALRYSVFYEEFNATPTDEMRQEKRDINEFDPITDHLIVIDTTLPKDAQIIGTYRLLRQETANKYGKFYTSDEFDIAPLLNTQDQQKGQQEGQLLELGRSCVLLAYRTRPVLQKLWEGIAHYVADNQISLMFGCASIPGTAPEAVADILSYLHHYHLAPPDLRVTALPDLYLDMNMRDKNALNPRKIFSTMPPLLKGYLRLGAYIGEGAIIDKQWDSIDVCIVLPSAIIKEKYVKHYERKTNKSIPAGEKMSGKNA